MHLKLLIKFGNKHFCTFLLLISLSLNLGTITYGMDEALGKVVFVNILFRHGDRTPIDPYPTDPYRNESQWPVPFGELTNIGKHQHLILGRWLRKRYSKLIPKAFSVNDIYVRSTDVDRTLMSAQANLAGLYPPTDDQKWDIKDWMPIPVHTVPQSEDYVLASKKYCDKYTFEYERVLNSPEMKSLNEANQQLYNYLTKHSGRKISSLETVEFLYNTLFIETLWNKTLPGWTKSVYPDKMKSLAQLSFTTETYNKRLQRLKSGPLLKEMIHNMHQKSKRTLSPDRKVFMYSAHDETVANMLMTLNLFTPHCPPYASTLLIELRIDNSGEYVVTIFYKNSTEAMLMTLPDCNTSCPLKQFIRLTRDVIPENWEKECLVDFQKFAPTVFAPSVIAVLASLILTLIILMMIVLGFGAWFFKKENKYYTRLSVDGIRA